MAAAVSLQTVDYIVIAAVLLISLSIGVVFAVTDFKNATRLEYLLGGRRMYMVPVALSVFASFSSGIAYIGLPADLYIYGARLIPSQLGPIMGYPCAAFTLVPLFYPLRMTSIYEYLEMRFHSIFVRKMVLLISMLQTLCYMAIALLAPALALQAGATLPLWMSIGVVGVIGTIYTSIGGIKSVVWSDAFQSVIMLGGILAIIIKGDSIWRISRAGGRISFDEFDEDPRNRNTWLGGVLGGCVFWMGFICNQSTFQRISAMRSVSDAQKGFLTSTVIYILQSTLLITVGWTIYSYFASIQCDPVQAGYISNRNQLSLYFVMHALNDLPGIGGVYMASIFSGTLSTISTGINALAANTTEDLLKTLLQKVTESTATLVTKVLVFFYGFLIIGLSFGASTFRGSIVQISIATTGACAGPVFGVFLLGALVPWGNKYGAICGSLVAVTFNVWISLGQQLYGRKWKTLPSPSTAMCYLNRSITELINSSSVQTYFDNDSLISSTVNQSHIPSSKADHNDPYSYGFFLYDISYEWYSFIGAFITLVLGITISYFTRRYCVQVTDKKLLFPFVRKFWQENLLTRKGKIDTENNGVGQLVMEGCEMNVSECLSVSSSLNLQELKYPKHVQ